MIHELRIYECVAGRLPEVIGRFRDRTLAIWKRHGIVHAGFWTVAIGPSNRQLIYLLAWESLEERERKWASFQSDPNWIAARAETEANGPIVETIQNMILAPVDVGGN
jgi:hypothetical protein